jgi:hypothetical protein
MISIQFIADMLIKQFPGHNFIASDRIVYKVIQVDGNSELRITNDNLNTYHENDSVWLASITSSVGNLFTAVNYTGQANTAVVNQIADAGKATENVPSPAPSAPVSATTQQYTAQMAKDFETEEQ